MRRMLIDNARRKKRQKRGGDCLQVEFDAEDLAMVDPHEEVLAIDDALNKLAAEDPLAAQLVKLRLFAGFSIPEAAEALGLSRSTAYDHWTYARAWLRCQLNSAEQDANLSQDS